MSGRKFGVGVVGCGNIAGPYTRDLASYDEIDFRGVTDLDTARAQDLADSHGVQAYPSLDALLADGDVDVVVNLTTHHAHSEVIGRALDAGKHVHSEKPLTLDPSEAFTLVELAESKGLRLGCSPATFMGEAQQTAMRQVRDGRLGEVRVVYAEANWNMIESWHPSPLAFYDVGALYDVGVYPLTIATAMFGPAVRVTAYGSVVKPQRVTLDGTPFTVSTPDFVTALVELTSGVVVRLTTTFYVGQGSRQRGMEFHGDDGSLAIDCWQTFSTPVTFTDRAGQATAVPYVREPYQGIEWGRAVLDLVGGIRDDRPHRATGRQAAHVVDILDAVKRSYTSEQPVPLTSTFTPPAPMEWATRN